jgi:hypothetical protein
VAFNLFGDLNHNEISTDYEGDFNCCKIGIEEWAEHDLHLTHHITHDNPISIGCNFLPFSNPCMVLISMIGGIHGKFVKKLTV